MSQVRLAISPARRPALAASKTITRLRRRMPGAASKNKEVVDVAKRKYFCLLAWHTRAAK